MKTNTRIERLQRQSALWPSTQLGIGAVSRVTVDAAISLANTYRTNLMIIASRGQVDREALGGGYAENWNAERLAAHVRARDTGNYVLLCRDHGGLWLHPAEKELTEKEALASACLSYQEDIAAGFDIIHLDTSCGQGAAMAGEKESLARLKLLFEFCQNEAGRQGRTVAFEVGTEEQDSLSHDTRGFFGVLDAILEFTAASGLPKPLFVVAQTGTKVMQASNIGVLDAPMRIEGVIPTELLVPRLVAGCNKRGVMLKQHNTDYLPDSTLCWHPWLGIHSANVAPEFGVVESRAFARLLRGYSLKAELEAFWEQAYASEKWRKWIAPDCALTDEEKALLVGHYIFSTPQCRENRARAAKAISAKGGDLEKNIFAEVEGAIFRYMKAFRLVGMPWKK
jgi:hypothetical protein